MKLIHCADIHLGSVLSSLPQELTEERKTELRNSFRRMVEYAQGSDIPVILLSGDVFDRDKPFKKDSEFFYSLIESAPKTDFLYLRGNHDIHGEQRELSNLKTFSEEWTTYTYGEVTVSGIELSPSNSGSYASTLSLDENKKNVVMLHGQEGSEINIGKLRDKYIDYLALGHVHSYQCGRIDNRGTYAYCGCLEGRGFDETGEKGFVVLDTDGNGITHTFHPFSQKTIEEHRIDISGLSESFKIANKIKDAVILRKNGIYRIILIGETDADTLIDTDDIEVYLSPYCGHISVKDQSARRIDYTAYQNDLSLKGEFVRTVQSSDMNEDDKARIIAYGLKALSGESPE